MADDVTDERKEFVVTGRPDGLTVETAMGGEDCRIEVEALEPGDSTGDFPELVVTEHYTESVGADGEWGTVGFAVDGAAAREHVETVMGSKRESEVFDHDGPDEVDVMFVPDARVDDVPEVDGVAAVRPVAPGETVNRTVTPEGVEAENDGLTDRIADRDVDAGDGERDDSRGRE